MHWSMTMTRLRQRSLLFGYCALGFVWASYKWFFSLSRAMLGKWFTSSPLFSFRCLRASLRVCHTLYFLPVCQCLVLLCDMISCSHSMYNAYPKLYVTCLSSVPPPSTHTPPPPPFPSPLQPSLSWHSNAQALAHECFIWPHIRPISSRFMTPGVGLFLRIPRQDTIHGRCVWYLCFQILRAATLQAYQGSCKEKPSIFFSRPPHIKSFLYSLDEKEKEAPGNFYYTFPSITQTS